MICYRDMTFCTAICGNEECGRNFTDEKAAAAKEWWKGFGKLYEEDPDGAPVAFSDFKDTDMCPGFKEKEKENV